MDATVNRATRRSFQGNDIDCNNDAHKSGSRRIEVKKETQVSHEGHLQGL